jgi:hypothetical protein
LRQRHHRPARGYRVGPCYAGRSEPERRTGRDCRLGRVGQLSIVLQPVAAALNRDESLLGYWSRGAQKGPQVATLHLGWRFPRRETLAAVKEFRLRIRGEFGKVVEVRLRVSLYCPKVSRTVRWLWIRAGRRSCVGVVPVGLAFGWRITGFRCTVRAVRNLMEW